jgi:hypothetical protein
MTQQPQSPFTKPSRRRAAAEAFISGADTDSPRAATPPAAAPAPVELTPRAEKTTEREVASQTVRFTAREKNALQRLATAHRRSEHFIIKDILGPALLAMEKQLDADSAAAE